MEDNRKTVSDRNHNVFLLENLKTFLGRLFSDFNRMLKVNTYDVVVRNFSEIKDYSKDVDRIIESINNIPEQKDIDLSDVIKELQVLQMALERPEKDFPEYNDELVVNGLKMVETAIKEIKSPSITTQTIDITPIENGISKLVELLTPEEVAVSKEVEEVKCPVWLSEEIFYNDDDEIIKIVNHYDTMDIVEEVKERKTLDGTVAEWTKVEVQNG